METHRLEQGKSGLTHEMRKVEIEIPGRGNAPLCRPGSTTQCSSHSPWSGKMQLYRVKHTISPIGSNQFR